MSRRVKSIGTQTFNRNVPHVEGGGGEVFAVGLADGTNMGSGAGANYRLGAFHVWNDALSSSTILNNYNATKATYGK